MTEHFRCVWKKIGTFTVYKRRDGSIAEKRGGNVLAYVCTPELEVLHVIGAKGASEFRGELEWAVRLQEQLASLNGETRSVMARDAHHGRLQKALVERDTFPKAT